MRSVVHVEAQSRWGALFRSGLLAAARDAGNVRLRDAYMQTASDNRQIALIHDATDEGPRVVSGLFVSPGNPPFLEETWNRSVAARIPIWLSNTGWPGTELARAPPQIGGYIG